MVSKELNHLFTTQIYIYIFLLVQLIYVYMYISVSLTKSAYGLSLIFRKEHEKKHHDCEFVTMTLYKFTKKERKKTHHLPLCLFNESAE